MQLTEIIYDCLGKVKATDILEYDMKERSPFFDTMILASVDSERQASAVVNYIEEVNKIGAKLRGIEGLNTAWVLIDLYDVIISIFTHEEREHFALEKIYLDISCKKIV